jgi:hypothetical protein
MKIKSARPENLPVEISLREMSSPSAQRIFHLLHSNQTNEILTSIFMHIEDYRFILVCSEVCRRWSVLTQENEIWRSLCLAMWSGKAYVPLGFQSLSESGQSKHAFRLSLLDSKRTCITVDEITTLSFDFRFKKTAGKYWTELDPYWTSNQPMRINFHRDGSVSGFPWNMLQMKWYFVDEEGNHFDGKGTNIRVVVNGRCVPTNKVSRHLNWGFIIQVPCLGQTSTIPSDFLDSIDMPFSEFEDAGARLIAASMSAEHLGRLPFLRHASSRQPS